MKRVLLLSTTTGYQLRSFGDAARAAGATLTLATDRCDQLEDPWSDRAIAVRFDVEPDAVAAAVAACSRERPDAVVAVGDRPAVLAAHLTAALGLEGNPAAAATRQWLLTSLAGSLALLGALWAMGRDGSIAGYAALVACCGTLSWLLSLRRR